MNTPNFYIKPLHELEMEYILNAYVMCGKNKTHTARNLKIGIRTLQRKLLKWGVK